MPSQKDPHIWAWTNNFLQRTLKPMIGSRLRQFRQAKGMTLDQLAESSRVSRGTIHRIELDQVSPRLETLMDLCCALGTTLGSFFRLENHLDSGLGATGTVHETPEFGKATIVWLEHAEALIRCNADSLSVLDAQGRVVYESDSALHFHAGRPEERRTRPWWTCAHPDDQSALQQAFTSFVLGGEPDTLPQYRAAHRDGSWHWVRTHLSRQLDHPLIQGIIASTQDVTRLRELEEDLNRSQKAESLTLALGGVTHTFSNLLMGIQGHLELAEGKLPANNPALSHLRSMEAALNRASLLLVQMRDFAGNPLLDFRRLDLNAQIRSLAPTFQALGHPKVTFHFDLEPELPLLRADRKLIERLLANLVANACEALPGESGTVTIRTAQQQPGTLDQVPGAWVENNPRNLGPCALIEVSDDGCGMVPELLSKIFDPFFTTKCLGPGMGLATVKGTVRSHHGALRVMSEPHKGSCFQVYLPLAPLPAELLPEPSGHAKPQLAGAILIAEDDELLRTCIREMLEKLGHSKIVEAANGEQALHLYRTHAERIDLVVLDLDMPVMGGMEAFTHLRRLEPTVKVLFSTGAWDREAQFTAHLSESSTGILRKPYHLDDLKAALAALA